MFVCNTRYLRSYVTRIVLDFKERNCSNPPPSLFPIIIHCRLTQRDRDSGSDPRGRCRWAADDKRQPCVPRRVQKERRNHRSWDPSGGDHEGSSYGRRAPPPKAGRGVRQEGRPGRSIGGSRSQSEKAACADVLEASVSKYSTTSRK